MSLYSISSPTFERISIKNTAVFHSYSFHKFLHSFNLNFGIGFDDISIRFTLFRNHIHVQHTAIRLSRMFHIHISHTQKLTHIL